LASSRLGPEALAANRIIIAPDGVLNLLPFEALRDDTGEYLLKSHVISYVPSGTVLDVLSRVERHERAPRPFLGIGDVAYENQGDAGPQIAASNHGSRTNFARHVGSSGMELHDLPQTRERSRKSVELSDGTRLSCSARKPLKLHSRKEPLDSFASCTWLCTGSPDTQYPERSALILGADPKFGDDGLLQVREIVRLRLNAELTTLSACDTGVGKLQGQEGVSNLVEAVLGSRFEIGCRKFVERRRHVRECADDPFLSTSGGRRGYEFGSAKRET